MTDHRDAPPPRIPEQIVRLVAGRDVWADTSAGDLREEFAAVQAERGRVAARLWYYGQCAQLLLTFTARALERALLLLRSLVRPQGDPMLRTLVQETRLAIRALIRQPLVTGVVLLTLALGLGANAATFGMIDSLLLRPFPIDGVDDLIMLSENSADDPYPTETVSPGNFADFHQLASSLDGVAAFRWWDVNLASATEPERLDGFSVTADFFRVLRLAPARGRLIDAQDTVHGRHRQVVLSDALWKRRFGSDPAVVGTSVTLDGVPHTVIGITPPGFDFPNGSNLWVPYAPEPALAADRGSHELTVIGRLRPGVTREAVAAEFDAVYERIKTGHPEATRGRRIVVRAFTEGMVDIGMPRVLALWQAAAIVVLLIGCTNITNLMLARGAARQRELAVRLAIGAGRWRLMRQLLIESLVLALVALPLALAVAAAALQIVKAAMPGELVRFVAGWQTMNVDATVVAFTIAAAVITAIVFGVLPAIQLSRPSLTSTLRDGGRSITGGAARSRLRRGLVVAEIAVALPLLIASGLSALGAHRFATGPQGYDPDGVFRLRTILPEATYPDDDSRRRFAEQVVRQALEQPGVVMAATTTTLPSSPSNAQRRLEIDGRPADPERPLSINYRAVSANYLPLLRVPIVAGRGLMESDRANTERVVVITRSAADRHWPGESPIGRRIRLGGADRPWTTIVGISGDTIDDWFNRRRVPTVYVPVAQAPSVSVAVVLRTHGDPATLATAARAAVAAVDPTQPVFEAVTMRDALRIRTTGLRFIGGMMAVFGVLALVLASLGIYSVMAYHVAQRRHEMGIRMALGATAGDVLRLTVGQGARMAALGIAIGLAFGLGLARVLESALFGVVAAEPWLFAAVALTLAAIACLASVIPARFAAATDPLMALREA